MIKTGVNLITFDTDEAERLLHEYGDMLLTKTQRFFEDEEDNNNLELLNSDHFKELFDNYRRQCIGLSTVATNGLVLILLLTDVDFMSHLSEIDGTYLFYNMAPITKVVLPDNLNIIDHGLFRNCVNLKEIVFNSNLEQITGGSFINCTSLTSVDLSKTRLKKLGPGSFASCSELTDIYIPKTLTYLGYKAFEECYKLKNIHFGGTRHEWLNIDKGIGWMPDETPGITINCVDGVIYV